MTTIKKNKRSKVDSELLTINEACKLLRISRRLFDRAKKENKIKLTQFGDKKILIHINEVNRLKVEGFSK